MGKKSKRAAVVAPAPTTLLEDALLESETPLKEIEEQGIEDLSNLVSSMVETNAATDAATIAELRALLADRDSKIVEKQVELVQNTTSFREVISERNKKIKELEDEISRMKGIEIVNNDILKEIKELRSEIGANRAIEKKEANTIEANSGINQPTPTSDTGAISGTIRARFTNISDLAEPEVFSHSVNVAGLDWAINLSIIRDGYNYSNKWICMYLHMITENVPESWSCRVDRMLKLLSDGSKDLTCGVHKSVFTPKSRGFGTSKLIEFKDLLNRSNGYVTEDSILLEIDFTVYPPEKHVSCRNTPEPKRTPISLYNYDSSE